MEGIKQDKAGFTVVELLVVVVILGMLLMVAVPSFSGLQVSWKSYICAENRKRLLMVIQSEAVREGGQIFDGAEYVTRYGMACPREGEWLLEYSGSSLIITCTECEQ